MSSVLNQPAPAAPSKRGIENVAELLHALGDIPAERVLMDPPPGTATEADLLRKVESEDRLVELVEGTLVEKPVGYREARLAALLVHHLLAFVLPRKLGMVSGPDSTMRVYKTAVRLPDVAYVSFARLRGGKAPLGRVPDLSPDLAIEVLSKSNTRQEMSKKRGEYLAGGTRLVWEVDPDTRTAKVYTSPHTEPRTLTVDEVLDGGDVLPGFSLPLRQLFDELDVEVQS